MDLRDTVDICFTVIADRFVNGHRYAQGYTETSGTDSKIIIKDTTEQNKTDSRDEHMKSH